ncbi:hypothetical protein AmaxDRAFT_4625 [Limnospira maxima CS-328]|uniref:Uncharacterized protein n=1 Tax=Limnospira maxima CS-328 TaxID=513049 RepID=B5W775_LIMMA|nr:hypothetical protein [Limnospira maxima]EDZ92622.1 hypothetical protein AmaxDRAFT_4625 [Limnospira maxima CS-328]MDC0838652.1 hypothetical protein [Limnoraphis robusta]
MHKLSTISNIVEKDLLNVQRYFDINQSSQLFTKHLEGREFIAVCLHVNGWELLLLFSESYPTIPPILLVTGTGKNGEQLPLNWSLTIPAEQRLINALNMVINSYSYSPKLYDNYLQNLPSRQPQPNYRSYSFLEWVIFGR